MAQPIFIIGGSHCGTTLMATILGSHDQCSLIPLETCVYVEENKNLSKKYFKNAIASIESNFVVEKTPRHLFSIEQMKLDFPESKFICMTRNSIDVVASLYRRDQEFNSAIYQCSNDLSGCLEAVAIDNVLLVEYESLITDFYSTVKNVCDFIGISYQPDMKNFYQNAPTWFENLKDNDDHLDRRSRQMLEPIFDGRGMFRDTLSSDQIDQIIFDCSEKYYYLTQKHLA